MTDLTPFTYGEHPVRVVNIDGEPWFVATDVAAILELANVRSSLALLDADERGVQTVDTPGGAQQMNCINEPGLYSLILRSRKPEARDFKRWVTHEVLPSIRKTGSYGAPRQLTDDEIVHHALQITSAKVAALEARIEADRPAVEYVRDHVIPDDAMTIPDWGQHYNLSRHESYAVLVANDLVYRKLIGYRWSASAGRKVEEHEYRIRAGHHEWFQLRAQHNAPRLHNGQVRQTLYVRAGKASDVARACNLLAAELPEVAA